MRLNYIETLKGIKDYNRIKLNTLCALKNKVSNYGFNSLQCIVRCFTCELEKQSNEMKIRSVPEKKCIKLCGQTLRFYPFASNSAVSFVRIFENSGKYEQNNT